MNGVLKVLVFVVMKVQGAHRGGNDEPDGSRSAGLKRCRWVGFLF